MDFHSIVESWKKKTTINKQTINPRNSAMKVEIENMNCII